MKRLYVLVILVLLLFSTCLTAYAEELVKVRLNEVVHSIFYVPQYIALHLGFFEEEGLSIDLTTAWGGDKAATALMTNSADIALIGPETTIYIYVQGAENYLVNFAQLTNRAGSFLLARQPMLDFSWEDVRGKVIVGNRPGGAPQMVMEWVLSNEGVIPQEDVKIITNLDFTANAGAFVGGLGDFVQLFEPNASLLEAEGVGYVVSSLGHSAGQVPYTVYMARKEYIAENPEVIQKFTNAIYRAQRWVYSHSVEEITTNIYPFFPDTDVEILQSVVKRYLEQETWATTPFLAKEIFDHWQDIVILAGELEEKAPYDVLVDPSFAEKAIEVNQN